LRLWFAAMAYVLLCALRRIGLHHTRFDNASCGTIRLKLIKIGALVSLSVRRIKIAMASRRQCDVDRAVVADDSRWRGSLSPPPVEHAGTA
jgi:Transposase DDE domain group 1